MVRNFSPPFDISIHALREEGDLPAQLTLCGNAIFLSTPSARRATSWATARIPASQHFYPRPPRGGRLAQAGNALRLCNISIHALREEGDLWQVPSEQYPAEFLSTPSARRATRCLIQTGQTCDNFYPRPPRGGRQLLELLEAQYNNFYPRPPRGGRPARTVSLQFCQIFLSTPSARRATGVQAKAKKDAEFLSTPSARRATYYLSYDGTGQVFLSTPSARRATC